mmetsp:Transcript_118591/g.221614  ORF Transcript_118591/g.221614 Transcript_118591/m.221614 type:complete len:154 (+) Transcript_118591:84-545(+)
MMKSMLVTCLILAVAPSTVYGCVVAQDCAPKGETKIKTSIVSCNPWEGANQPLLCTCTGDYSCDGKEATRTVNGVTTPIGDGVCAANVKCKGTPMWKKWWFWALIALGVCCCLGPICACLCMGKAIFEVCCDDCFGLCPKDDDDEEEYESDTE